MSDLSRKRIARAALGIMTMAVLGLTAACSSAGTSGATTDNGSAATEFPDKDITLVVPYAAGGPTDISARALAVGMEEALGVTVIVENKPGASGITGLSEVAAAAPDGYTVTYSTGDGFVQSELRDAPYTFDSFTPIAGTITQPYVIVSAADSGIDSFEDLADQDRVTYAVTGIGTPTHINTAIMFDEMGVESTAVPFDGAGPATQAVVGGQTNIAMLDASVVMPFVNSGDLVALATFGPSEERLEYTPETPSLEELDVKTGDMTLTIWGAAAPVGIEDDIVGILRDAVLQAAQGDQFQEFAQNNFMPLLEGDDEVNWYSNLEETAESTKAALERFGITLQ